MKPLTFVAHLGNTCMNKTINNENGIEKKRHLSSMVRYWDIQENMSLKAYRNVYPPPLRTRTNYTLTQHNRVAVNLQDCVLAF